MPPLTTPSRLRHSAHDFGLLMSRWDKVMQKARLAGVPLGSAGELPIWGLESAAAAAGGTAIYLSAGVHGDEPAGAWALLQWAESHLRDLRKGAFLLVPCFNPVGFIGNTRADAQGVDINRCFDEEENALMATWRSWIASRSLALGICLHEDYDALGCYVYELSGRRKPVSEPLMKACESLMRRDGRSIIDGRAAKRGIIRREKIPKGITGPEAIVLRHLGCPVTLTFETASELALGDRVSAQLRFIEGAVAAAAHE